MLMMAFYLLFPHTFLIQAPTIHFEDRSTAVGIDVSYFNGAHGTFLFPEIVGGGVALLDYDGDGDLDVYWVQGAALSEKGYQFDQAVLDGAGPLHDRLFRNDLDRGNGLRFTEVTQQAGIDAKSYGVGVAVGDVDNNGYPDLYITNYGPNQLWLNQGNGTFKDVSLISGTADAGFASSATMLDVDGDGLLDIFVANYVAFDPEDHPKCYASGTMRDYCGPNSFPPAVDRLYRNKGDGTFENISTRLKGSPPGPGLGALALDYNGDGHMDIFVANDGQANFLWRNNGKGYFEEEGLLAGVALNAAGKAEAGMGIAAGDPNGDGLQDLFLSHLDGETNTLYIAQEGGFYEDRTASWKLAAPSLPYTGFGTVFLDVDRDGWEDLTVVNGAVRMFQGMAQKQGSHPMAQVNLLFLNQDGKQFQELGSQAGPDFGLVENSRGVAFGDLDNDGDVDLAIANNSGKGRILLNQTKSANAWVGIQLTPPKGHVLPGAYLDISLPNRSKPLRRWFRTDGSYCAASDPRVLLGLGQHSGPVDVTITFPDGFQQAFKQLKPGKYHKLSPQN